MNFPGRKAQRREDAERRQEAWAKLSPQTQLKRLDKRLGKSVVAKRQRERLAKLISEK